MAPEGGSFQAAGISRKYQPDEFLTTQSVTVCHDVSGIWGQGPVLSDLPTPDLPVVRMPECMAEKRLRPAEGHRGRSVGNKPCFSWNNGSAPSSSARLTTFVQGAMGTTGGMYVVSVTQRGQEKGAQRNVTQRNDSDTLLV